MINVNLKTIFVLGMVGFMNIAIPVVMDFFSIEYSVDYPVIIDDSEMSCNIFEIKVQNKTNISEEENKNKDDLIEQLKQQQKENLRKIRNLGLENKTMFTLLDEKNKLLEEKDKVIGKVKEENRLMKQDPQKKLCQCIVYSGLTDE